MGEDAQDIIVPFLGALQASIAVLLTIFAGVLGAQFNLLSEPASKEVSKICVQLFLPALLITRIGSEVHLETITRYYPIVIWALAYGLISILLGLVTTRLLKTPAWVTPAMAFNNTTSLPLLLVQALATTKLLDVLDSSGGAVQRAESYFLVNAMVGNTLTFALGPKLLDVWHEEARDSKKEESEEDMDSAIDVEASEAESANEQTSLLPDRIVRAETGARYAALKKGKRVWSRLPSWSKRVLDMLYQFVNTPIIGAAIGAVIGLVPPLHRLFFNSQEDGGYLNAWLTSALQNVGDIFPPMQVVVTGVKLSASLLKMKKGEESGKIPLVPFFLITIVRFVVWPAISIGVIYALATRTELLGDDPILWFSMMLMPTGPPALLLTALADVTGADEQEKMSIAKFLTIEYAISPVVFLAVVGSLKASEAAVRS